MSRPACLCAASLSLLWALSVVAGCDSRALEYVPEPDGGIVSFTSPDLSLGGHSFAPDFAVRPPDLAMTPPDLATVPPDFAQLVPDLALPPPDLWMPPPDLVFVMAPHPPMPQVLSEGGPVLAVPEITSVTFLNDPLANAADTMTAAVPSGPYWTATTSDYGVGAAKVRAPVHLNEMAPAKVDDTQIQKWLVGKLNGMAAGFGVPNANSVFVIFYPDTTTITYGGATSCQEFGGYHGGVVAAGGVNVAYAVLPRCKAIPTLDVVNSLSLAASHEIIEACTDPYPDKNPTYTHVDADDLGWDEVIGGTEVGDMCEINQISQDLYTRPQGMPYAVQRTWSNSAARANHDPCVLGDGQVYFQSTPVLLDKFVGNRMIVEKGIAIPVGKQGTLEVDLWSDGPTTAWTVGTRTIPNSTATYQFSWDKTTGQNGDKLHLTVSVLADTNPAIDGFYITSRLGQRTHLWPVAVKTAP